jgi:catechol 2,3-dioxygenase-like lactoylglutathione lyase family enzyme
MNLRIARHTKDLNPIINFYRSVLGLEIIGEFKNHNNYDGVFLGNKSADWHLEFTTSLDTPNPPFLMQMTFWFFMLHRLMNTMQ